MTAITANKETWIATMLAEEYGLAASVRSPVLAGAQTSLAFVLCGSIPLLPYLLGLASPRGLGAPAS